MRVNVVMILFLSYSKKKNSIHCPIQTHLKKVHSASRSVLSFHIKKLIASGRFLLANGKHAQKNFS